MSPTPADPSLQVCMRARAREGGSERVEEGVRAREVYAQEERGLATAKRERERREREKREDESVEDRGQRARERRERTRVLRKEDEGVEDRERERDEGWKSK
jgi:hypothetical protein